MYGAGAAFIPMGSIALLAIYILVSGLLGVVYDRKRYRPVPRTLNSAAPGGAGVGLGGQDNVSIAGPFNEISFQVGMTTDAHTVDGAGAGGLARAFMQLSINSTKRGNLALMDSMTLYMLSSLYFNTAAYSDTVGGLAEAPLLALLPLGVDADESVNVAVSFGNAVDLCSTADLGAAGCTAMLVTLSVELLPGNPNTYYAYRNQSIGAMAIAAVQQLPTIPVVPGFCLCKEAFVTQPTSRVTACALSLANITLAQADDYIIGPQMPTITIQNQNTSQKGFLARNGYIMTEHTPIQNNDCTLLTIVNGAVAIVAPSEVLYVYMAGQVSKDGNFVTPPAANNPAAANGAPANPTRTQKGDRKRGFVKRLFGRR